MNADFRTRLGFWLERITPVHPLLFRFDGIGPGERKRYINRVNGHVVMEADA